MMTNSEKLALMETRLKKLRNNPKNIKCPGVVRKLSRQVRNLKSKENE